MWLIVHYARWAAWNATPQQIAPDVKLDTDLQTTCAILIAMRDVFLAVLTVSQNVSLVLLGIFLTQRALHVLSTYLVMEIQIVSIVLLNISSKITNVKSVNLHLISVLDAHLKTHQFVYSVHRGIIYNQMWIRLASYVLMNVSTVRANSFAKSVVKDSSCLNLHKVLKNVRNAVNNVRLASLLQEDAWLALMGMSMYR